MKCQVEYATAHNTLCRGYVIDSMESPLTGKCRLLVADGPNADPRTDGKWLDARDCEEVDDTRRNGQSLSQFI